MLAQKHRFAEQPWLLVGALVVLTTLLLAPIVFAFMDPAQWDLAFDFRLLWLAGSTWQQGYSPYMPEFDAIYAAHFGGGQASWHVFNYPPHFSVVALALAVLPYRAAATVWLGINVFCIVASAAVLTCELAPRSLRIGFLVYAAIVGFALTSYAAGYSLFYGQTSLLILLGACLVLRGYTHRRAMSLGIGLVLLSLKPNIGLLPSLVVAGSMYDFGKRQWQGWALGPVLVTALFVAAGTMLSVGIAGIEATLAGFAARIEAYSATPPSQAASLTGLAYLVDTLTGASTPLWLTLALAGTVCAFGVRKATDRALAMCSVLAATFFFVPLHTYDLVVVVALVPLCWLLSMPRAAVAMMGMVAVHRCVNIALEVNPRSWFDDGLLPASIGTLLLLAMCLGVSDSGRRQLREQP